MAGMQPRGSGASAGRRRSGGGRGVVRRVFEDFKPVSEWKQDDDSHILSIDLPGFMKEQIKVWTQGHNTIIVEGERLVGGNKWSRFHEEFEAPAGEMNSLQVDYQGGTLHIKVPREVVEKSETNNTEPMSLDYVLDQLPSHPRDQTKDSSEVDAQEATNDESSSDKGNYDAFQELAHKVAEETNKEKEENYEGSHWVEPSDKAMLVEDRTSDILENIEKNEELYVGKTKAKKYKMVGEENDEIINERILKMNIKVAMFIIVAIIAYIKYKFASLGEDYRA